MVDRNNAHKRSEKSLRRQSGEVEAEDAKRLLNDPAYQRGFENVRNALISLIENFQHDGSPEADANEREICRSLRTLTRTKRAMALGIQGQVLKAADFRPHAPNDETDEA